MSRTSRSKVPPVVFGPLPVRALNHALGLELGEGEAIMSANAQQHARSRHSRDFARCFPHVASVIATPLYARDDFRNDGKIELVGRPVGLADYLLVAVEIVMDVDGRYRVASFYPISEKKVAARRDSGHLRRLHLKKKAPQKLWGALRSKP